MQIKFIMRTFYSIKLREICLRKCTCHITKHLLSRKLHKTDGFVFSVCFIFYILNSCCVNCRPENEKTLTSDSSSTDVKSFFSNCNVAALRQLGGGRVLLDLCLSLPEFSKIALMPAGSSPLMNLTSSRLVLKIMQSS